jgi:uncharacterized protein (DUF1330 family)
MAADERHYQLVLIWLKDRATFQEYLRLLPPIVTRYGGAADRSFRPTAIWAEDLELPGIVNLVHYDDKASYERFERDPDFQEIEHLRRESVDLMSCEGRLVRANPSRAGLAERVYHIELVRYRDGSPAAYQRYEREGEAAMSEYGFDVEYVLAIDPDPAGSREFDLAKISYFPTTNALADFEKDPRHKEIEAELYPAAVERAVWITAAIA